nr:hypothetical protein [Tanacetum cinerariifolium]
MMASFFQINIASTSGSRPLPRNTIANPKGELKAITTRSGIVIDGPSFPMPFPFINPEEDERVEETLTDPELGEFTIKVPPLLVQKSKPPSQRNFVVHQRILFTPISFSPSRTHKQKQQEKDEVQIHKALLSNKEKLLELANTPLNENCLVVILKKLPEKLGDLEKFLIPGIARDVFVSVDKFTFPPNFVIVDYESDPRVPLILGRPFLRTAHALIDVHGEEIILHDGDERLTLNMRHDTSSYSNQPQKESINMINIFNDSHEDYLEDFTTSSSPDYLLEEFADKLALIIFPLGNDYLPFDIEFDLKRIEYLLNHDPTNEMDSILKDSIDEDNLVDPNDNLFDTIPEMFTNEHALDYSSPPLYDEYDDDLYEFESDIGDAYNDPFDSKGEKIKESKLLIDELDLPRSSDFLPSLEYDSFLFKDFSEVVLCLQPTTRTKIAQIVKTRACGFILRSLDLHILNFILGIQYPNLID